MVKLTARIVNVKLSLDLFVFSCAKHSHAAHRESPFDSENLPQLTGEITNINLGLFLDLKPSNRSTFDTS